MCLFTQIAFIECLLCAWHLQDTGNMTMSSLMQTGAQPSGNLHSGGRGDQIIVQITSLLSQTRGMPATPVLGGEKELTAPT